MEFKTSDFDRCLVNPFRGFKMADELVEKCDAFHYEEFTRQIHPLSRNKVLRYIVMVYDKETPLLRLNDMTNIKNKAAEMAGFKKTKNRFSTGVQKIILCENPNINDMIMRYVRNHNNHLYSYFVALQEEYYRNLRDMHGGSSNKKSITEITKVREELDEVRSDLLNNDRSQNLEEKLAALQDFEELKLRPENIADAIAANEQPVTAEEVSEG